MDLTQKIKALIDEASQLQGSKAKNKVIARLEEAELWSKELPKTVADQIADNCTCPLGAIDSQCPIHA